MRYRLDARVDSLTLRYSMIICLVRHRLRAMATKTHRVVRWWLVGLLLMGVKVMWLKLACMLLLL
jgi:hypothetical protein